MLKALIVLILIFSELAFAVQQINAHKFPIKSKSELFKLIYQYIYLHILKHNHIAYN